MSRFTLLNAKPAQPGLPIVYDIICLPGEHVQFQKDGVPVWDHIEPATEVPVPPQTGGQPPSGLAPVDISGKISKVFTAQEGGWVPFYFDSPNGGQVECWVVRTGNSDAKKGDWVVDGGPQMSWTPSGDFRFTPIPNGSSVKKGRHYISVAITGILGDGQFMIQVVGAGTE